MDDAELIKWIAENVMGWEMKCACTYRNKGENELLYYPGTNCVIDAYTFDPINNLNHAFMVVEALMEKNIGIELYANPKRNQPGQGRFVVKMWGEKYNPVTDDYLISWSRWQDKPGKAICIATKEALS